MRVLEGVLAAILLLVGIRSGVVSIRGVEGVPGGSRALIALHETAKAGFWLSLGAFFLGYALLDEPGDLRWLLLIPISMAGLRLIAAALLARE